MQRSTTDHVRGRGGTAESTTSKESLHLLRTLHHVVRQSRDIDPIRRLPHRQGRHALVGRRREKVFDLPGRRSKEDEQSGQAS